MEGMENGLETLRYHYRDNPLFGQGRPECLKLIFEALDALDEPVLIVGPDTQICYFNSAYLGVFGPDFARSGIPAEEITNWKLTNMEDNVDVAPILEVLKNRSPTLKHYSVCGQGRLTTFSDIIPLTDGEILLGAVIIHRDATQIAHMSHEMNRYRTIADELRRELDAKDNLPLPFRSVIGSSPEFMRVLRTAAQVAPSAAAVCLTGESGTGKEVVAKAIHLSSRFSGGPFIQVNCAAIPESLIESELFGYEKGAFTGAKATGNPGKFELANNGTLFLDEIGEMPLSMQVKLLRAIQEREITRVGGSAPIQLSFRLITATNCDLETMAEDGSFREDLFYRINVIPLQLPPLRQRRSDIPVLANHFLIQFTEEYGGDRSFTSEVLQLLSDYSWPGNIRELKNCVERLAVLSPDKIIGTEQLPPHILNCRSRPGRQPVEHYRLQTILNKTERDTIQAVLGVTNGNKSKAIEILGISKRNFYMKLEKYGLK